MLPAIVLSADTNGLGAVRSLAEAGVPTVAVVVGADQPALHSRFPRKLVVPPGPNLDAALVEALGTLEAEGGVLLPTSDAFVRFLEAHRDELARRFFLALPPPGVLPLLLDKGLETTTLAGLGVPLPRTVADLPADANRLLDALGLPMILKPRSAAFRPTFRAKTFVIRRAEELHALYARHADNLHGLVAQEFIPGDESALWVCDATFDQTGELVRAFTFRKVRTSPPRDGVTSFGRSEANPALVERARALGRALRYTGPADLDFKYDERDGSYRYLELNPRLGMCNHFAACCGVNVALDAYRVAQGLPPAVERGSQKDGVLYVNLFDDLYSRLKDGEPALRVLRHYAGALVRRRCGAVFAWNDPWPGLRVGWGCLAKLAGSAIRKVGRKLRRPAFREAVAEN